MPRNIQQREDPARQIYNPADFPFALDGIIYVRQSTEYQRENNIHSYEMQTSKFEEHFRKRGCIGHIEIIADDEDGKTSGTLAIHNRPGLSRIVKLLEKDGGKRIGWIAAVAVNRFTRDKWLVTPGTLMQLCYDHNVWISTLRMDFNFKDDYCQRVFMLEAEEAARHLEWMKVILGGGKKAASNHGYYDGRPVAPGYIVDRSDPTRKKYVLYEPTVEPTLQLFRRFFALDYNFTRLCREVEAMPYLYPPFESWVDKKTIAKFGIKQIGDGPYKGYYKPTRSGLVSILTNPVYIGWWLPLSGGYIPNNHPRLIPEEEEMLFWLAHKRLSVDDLNGNRQREPLLTRYGQAEGLLKKILETEDGQHFYAIRDSGRDVYRCTNHTGLVVINHILSINVSVLDPLFLARFFEQLRNWKGYTNWEEQMEQLQKQREERVNIIKRQIAQARRQWQESMDILKNPDIRKTTQMRIDLGDTCAGLEQRIADLEKDLEERLEGEEDDTVTQYKIPTLLLDLIENWENMAFTTRLRLVNALTRKVVVSCPAPAFFKVAIHWKRPTWGVDVAIVRRPFANATYWTKEEDALLRNVYEKASPQEILKLYPERSWVAIKHRGVRLGLQRNYPHRSGICSTYQDLSLRDLEFAKEHGIAPNDKTPHWCPKTNARWVPAHAHAHLHA